MFHWLVVAGVVAYLWWLMKKVAKPKPITQPVDMPRGTLVFQIILAWICVVVVGIWTFPWLILHRSADDDISGRITDMILSLGMPLLFALSVRWARTLMSKWEPLKASVENRGEGATLP